MKKSIAFAILPLFVLSLNLQAQNAEKTLVKAFNLKGNHTVHFDLDGDIDIQTWNQSEMRVMMTINLPTGSDVMLKNLVKVGRYNLNADENDQGLKVYAPGLERQVKMRNGTELEENISMLVYVPHDVQVSTNRTLTEELNNEN